MLRKSFPILLLLLCHGTPISAHDAFYPHHREDFENMARRRELRTTVLLSTAAFLGILGTVVYVALRKSRDDRDVDEVDTKTAQTHLEHAINRAANAAQQALEAREISPRLPQYASQLMRKHQMQHGDHVFMDNRLQNPFHTRYDVKSDRMLSHSASTPKSFN